MKRFIKARPRLYRVARQSRQWVGRRMLRPRTVPGVPGRVHPNDLMAAWGEQGFAEGYGHSGRQATDLVTDALHRVGRTTSDVSAALDFGCGYGRVLRYVVEEVEPDRIWVTDIDSDAVAFCTSEFGVHPVDTGGGIYPLARDRFDLVYAFSVLTHLPESEGRELVAFFGRATAPGAVVVFTTHGRTSLTRLPAYGDWCVPHTAEITREVHDRGFSYRPYPHYGTDEYGLAWHDPEYVRELVASASSGALDVVNVGEHALDDHQDVYVLKRT